jgi:putative SOS response-associated peptidase YedK
VAYFGSSNVRDSQSDALCAWLSPVTVAALIIEPFAPISAYRVSTLVNKPENDEPECMEPID